MASLKLFSVIFIVLLGVAAATTYTTTVTTITTTEDEGRSSEQCEGEIQSKELDMCESFLSTESGRLRMIVQRGEQEQDEQKQCCKQLKQVKSQCRCAAIEDVVKQQMKGSKQSMQTPKMKKVLQKAQNLPRACDWQQPQECSFHQPSSFA